jgi:hypothetical protein
MTVSCVLVLEGMSKRFPRIRKLWTDSGYKPFLLVHHGLSIINKGGIYR